MTSLISITYLLEVHLYHKGLTMGSKLPPAVLPINIVPAEHISIDAKLVEQVAPPNWNPKVFSNVNC